MESWTINLLANIARRFSAEILFWLTYLPGSVLFWRLRPHVRKSELDLTQVRRILIVRLDEIGDVVLTTPLLRELRQNLSSAWITLVVKPEIFNLVELCPYLNEILTYNWRAGWLLKALRRHWRAWRLASNHLWRRCFDLAILPRWDIDGYHGTFLMALSGAPTRVGYSEEVTIAKSAYNRGFDRLLTQVMRDGSIRHEVEHNLNVVRFMGGEVRDHRLELWLGESDELFADEWLRRHEVKPNGLSVALGPGAGAPKRRWPLDSYAQIGEWLQNQYQVRIIIVGGPEDKPAGRELQNRLGHSAIDASGQTTLRQGAAILKRCALYIGNDAGPMHLAAAARIPVMELSCHPIHGSDWSANSPRRFGPWGTKSVIIQPKLPRAPCVDECSATVPHCILGISAEQVKEALTKLFSGEEFVCWRQSADTI